MQAHFKLPVYLKFMAFFVCTTCNIGIVAVHVICCPHLPTAYPPQLACTYFSSHPHVWFIVEYFFAMKISRFGPVYQYLSLMWFLELDSTLRCFVSSLACVRIQLGNNWDGLMMPAAKVLFWVKDCLIKLEQQDMDSSPHGGYETFWRLSQPTETFSCQSQDLCYCHLDVARWYETSNLSNSKISLILFKSVRCLNPCFVHRCFLKFPLHLFWETFCMM